jgi:hypothetical protein
MNDTNTQGSCGNVSLRPRGHRAVVARKAAFYSSNCVLLLKLKRVDGRNLIKSRACEATRLRANMDSGTAIGVAMFMVTLY